MKKVVLGTVIASEIIFVSQALAVYIVWGQLVNSDFITNLSHSNSNYIWYFDSADWLATTAQVLFFEMSLRHDMM